MEARLLQTNENNIENNIFNFDFNPEGCLFPTDEQNKFISSKAEEIENYFTNKNKFDKENNTVYGLPVEIVPFTLKPYNKEPIQTKAVKIGYIYIVETKDRSKNWTGMSCEEIVEAIFNNKETQKCFDALGLYFGLGVEGPYCSTRNIVKFYKDFPNHWCC